MTHGENIVSICQDNTNTDETIENNVNLQFFTGKNSTRFLFEKAHIEFFQTSQS